MSIANPKGHTTRWYRQTVGRVSNFLLTVFIFMIATAPTASATVLNSPSQTAINAAIAAPMIRYGRAISGGAYTSGGWDGGASIILAVASYAGNTSADARLLPQIRSILTAENEICANGGSPAQHELHATGMFAIAKQTPRIWNQLTTAEKTRIDLLMKSSIMVTGIGRSRRQTATTLCRFARQQDHVVS